MEGGLGFCFIRSKLFNEKYDDRAKEVFRTTKNEVLKIEGKYAKFMLIMMNLAEEEIAKGNLQLAGYDINLLHNLPESENASWDEKYFFSTELLGYYENLVEHQRIEKMKYIMKLVGEILL